MQLDMLWLFMQVDMEAERFDSRIRHSDIRQKLL